LLESGGLDPGLVDRPALDELPEAVADEPALGPIGAGSEPLVVGAAGFKWCSPTATEWAHNVPHSRDCRHGQMFSMSSSCRITNPARSEVASDITTPFSKGGVQFEDSTLPEASKARACFMTSQPAALAKKASVSFRSDTGLKKNGGGKFRARGVAGLPRFRCRRSCSRSIRPLPGPAFAPQPVHWRARSNGGRVRGGAWTGR